MVVGEIGVSRDDFLRRMAYWEIVAVIHGYFARNHPFWEMARFMSFCTVKSIGGCDNLSSAKDLMIFPWEKKKKRRAPLPDQEQVRHLQGLIDKENARLKQKET